MDTNSSYRKLSSTLTPNGGAGLRNRDLMDRLIGRDLEHRIINESAITDHDFLYRSLIPAWYTRHNAQMRNFIYTFPRGHKDDPWTPIPCSSASETLTPDLPLFEKKTGWCMQSLAYPRAGDFIDGPVEKESGSHDGVVNDKPQIGVESLTTQDIERIQAIRAVLNARQVKVVSVYSDGEVSGDEEDDDYDPSSSSSDSEGRDPTYTPSTNSSLTSSTASLCPIPPAPPASIETQYARLFNAIATVLSSSFGMTTKQSSTHPSSNPRRFCSLFATLPITGGDFKRKPDGILLDADVSPSKVTWRKVLAVLEYTEQEYMLSASVVRQMHMKSYMILRRQPWRTFVLGVTLTKKALRLHYYDRTGTIISCPVDIQKHPKQLINVIATLAYGSRSSLGYDPTIDINEDLLDQPRLANFPPTTRNTLAVDQIPLPDSRNNTQVIVGTVLIPGNKKLDILGIVWISDAMVGRGTVCYRVRDPTTLQEFALKDYWVDSSSINHETHMLEKLKNVPGVPKAICSWTVGDESDAKENSYAQNTLDIRVPYTSIMPEPTLLAMDKGRVHRRILMAPFAFPIYTFSSLKELVWSFLTIAETHESMTDAGVLHQDVSVNNLMIAPEMMCPPPVPPVTPQSVITTPSAAATTSSESTTPIPPEQGQSRRGWIVDFDYAKLLTTSATTSNGTGTLPFLSYRILCLMDDKSPKRKALEQTAEDDIESLFYVLIWICCLYEGPNNSPRQDLPFEDTICYNWAERAFENAFVLSRLAKSHFINQPCDKVVIDGLHPYFQPIFGLVQKWRKLIRDAYAEQTQVPCAEVRKLLQEAYTKLCEGGTTAVDDVYDTRRVKKRRIEDLMDLAIT